MKKLGMIVIVILVLSSFVIANFGFDDKEQFGFNTLVQDRVIYGEMYFNNDTTGVTTLITVQNKWENISGFNQESFSGQVLNGFDYDSSNDGSLIVKVGGKYDCSYDISTGNQGNNQEYQFALSVNEVLQNSTYTHRKIGVSGDVGDASDRGFIDLLPGDVINLKGRDNDGMSNLFVHSASVNCWRMGN